MTAKTAGRSTRRFKKQHAEFRAECEANDEPCHLCGQPINYDAPKQHPDAFNLDHYFPIASHPHLAEDPANYRASHGSCNASRGTKTVVGALGVPSRIW